MNCIRIIAVLFMLSGSLIAQHPGEFQYNRREALNRKKQKIQSAFFIREKYDTASHTFVSSAPPDTTGYELYDREGRVTKKWDQAAQKHEPFAYYWYDQMGNISRVLFCESEDTAWGYVLNYYYNNHNSIVKEVQYLLEEGIPELDYSVEYDYDEQNRVKEMRTFFALAPGLLKIHEIERYRYARDLIIAVRLSGYQEDTVGLDSTFISVNGWEKHFRDFYSENTPNKAILEKPEYENELNILKAGKNMSVHHRGEIQTDGSRVLWETDSSVYNTDGEIAEFFYIRANRNEHKVFTYPKKGGDPYNILYSIGNTPVYKEREARKYYK